MARPFYSVSEITNPDCSSNKQTNNNDDDNNNATCGPGVRPYGFTISHHLSVDFELDLLSRHACLDPAAFRQFCQSFSTVEREPILERGDLCIADVEVRLRLL